MDTVAIRRLDTADISAMRAMNMMFAEAFEDAETYRRDRPDADWLAEQLASPHVIALAAFDRAAAGAEAVIGGLVAYILPKLERAASEVYIYDLAVAEASRRRGVATALIAQVRAIAREVGAWVVYVQADYADEPAVALYTKLGVREDVLHFDIAP